MNRVGITSFKGILMNKPLTTKTGSEMFRKKLETSSVNEKESCSKNSLIVRNDKVETKNLTMVISSCSDG